MINSSFIFLDKIGKQLEKRIWQQGIKDWNTFIKTKKIIGISEKRKSYYDRKLIEARKALYNNDSKFFNLLQSETWRLYEHFKDQAIFIDIETTGVNKYDDITLIGLYDGIETKTMFNIDQHKLREFLSNYKLIVTFNGATFDLPYISKRYPKLLPDIPNFDLRTACQRVNLTGGLKQIEKQLDIKRDNKIVEKMHGGDPLRLLKMYKATGDEHYINLLIEYNEEDIINLKPIADYVTKKLKHLNTISLSKN